ncbi:META domain-containing protein [Halomonas sp. YLGW01]|uniref:META domain-containing protein n=1 Tax=Halomonas sp. YLGW01 TaxID=2773308 RepID=UPI00178740DD|nr:META domain-containing protein [Halomonas sp. YLGW01]
MGKGWFMGVVLAGLLAGCSATPPLDYSGGDRATAHGSPVIGPRWTLILIGTSKRWRHDRTPYFEVVPQGGELRLVGFDGCNRLNGLVRLESGERFAVDDLASTRMACPHHEDAEKVGAILEGSYRYLIDHDRLVLFGRDSRVLGGFRRGGP